MLTEAAQLRQMQCQSPPPVQGLSGQQDKRTLMAAETGLRAVKSWQVLERVLAGLEQECDAGSDLPAVATVRLSGLVHADERTAFQDIARQLCG